MHLRKITAAIVGSVLAIAGLISTPAQAGGQISSSVPALGLDLRENSELGRMPTVIYAQMDPNNQHTWLLCSSVNDDNCTKAPSIFGLINFDVCTPSSTLSCIADTWAIDPQGQKIQGTFVKSVPIDPRYDTSETPSVNLPASHGVGAVWKLPGVVNSGGQDTYFVSAQQSMWQQKPSGTTIASAGSLDAGELVAGIIPVQEITGNFNLVTAVDASNGGNAWGSNGTQYAPDGTPCAGVDKTYCEATRQFPAGYRFGLTINFGQKLIGWFHGRLHLPAITTKDWQKGEEVSIEAEPVKVPSLNFSVANADIPAPAKKLVFSGIDLGMEGDGKSQTKIVENLSGPYTMDLITAFTDAYKNTATTTDSYWSFRTLNSNSDAIQRCSDNSGNLAGLVTTNALSYAAGPPTFDKATGSLVYKVASPHFQADGNPAAGTYDLSIRSDVARCIYGFSKAPIHAEVAVISQDGTQQVATTTLSEKDGWLYLSANGFGYSNPTITVKLTQDAPAAVATPTPAASQSPSSAASTAAVAKPATSPKKTTITCIKGKTTKTVNAMKPTCPSGYKKK